MEQKFTIFILLWISLTFNLESNEMYSYFLAFYFLYARLETVRIMWLGMAGRRASTQVSAQ
jgi:hypothetical protein